MQMATVQATARIAKKQRPPVHRNRLFIISRLLVFGSTGGITRTVSVSKKKL